MEGTDADETLVAGIQKSIITTGMSRLGAEKALEDVESRGWAMDKEYGSFYYYSPVLCSTDSGFAKLYLGLSNFLRCQARTRNAIDYLKSSAWLI